MDARIAMVLEGVLTSALHDLEQGIGSVLFRRAAGVVIFDFVSLAENALENERKDVAAVLSAAAFEDSIKTKARELGLEVEGKDLPEVINALKTASFFKGPQARVASSFVTFRNNALHADWDKIMKPEVAGLIAFLKQFAAEELA